LVAKYRIADSIGCHEALGCSVLKVKVEYLGSIKNMIDGGSEEEIETRENASLVDLLIVLSHRHGEAFKRVVCETAGMELKPRCVITINGRLLNELNGTKSKLEHGDRVVLMPIVSGG